MKDNRVVYKTREQLLKAFDDYEKQLKSQKDKKDFSKFEEKFICGGKIKKFREWLKDQL